MINKVVMPLLLFFFISFANAQDHVTDSLKKIIALGRNDSTAAKTYIDLSIELSRSDITASKKCAQNATVLCKQLHLPFQLSAAYSLLTTLHVQIKLPDSARYYLALLKELAGEYSDIRIKQNYYFTAGLFYRKQGNYKASLPYMLESLRLITLIGSKTDIAGQCLNIGNNYVSLGRYKKAMVYHLKALGLFEALGNKRGLSFCYGAIGSDFNEMNQFAQALPYVQKSLILKNELDDKKGKVIAYIGLGKIYEGSMEYEKALTQYLEALTINKELQLSLEEAKTDYSIGKLYIKMKDITNARCYLNRSNTLFGELGDTAFVALVKAEMVNFENNISEQHTTERTFLATLATSVKTGGKNAEISNYKHLADFYARNGQFDKAFGYSEKYHNETDSLQNKELQLQIKRMEQQYNLEKKEQEISLLKKDRQLYQADRQKQKIYRYAALLSLLFLFIIGAMTLARYRIVQKGKRLLEIEKIRNNIARNLHDDIGSTLTSINILSKVALQQAGDNIAVRHDLEKIKSRTAIIMESMADIIWAINPANDPLDKTMAKMREFASEMLENAGISFSFKEEGNIMELKLGVAERKNLYLIFKEAINNMVKYSGATVTEIVLHRTADRFLMKISDNGIGFDHTKQYAGNGLKNMQSRAGEMNAAFKIDSSPLTGSIVYVSVPIT
jgi:two-component system sensor histidine kinase UhpB